MTTEQISTAEPVRIRDSRVILALTKALKSPDKALILWTLRGWVAHNQSKNKGYRDGHYWTFSPLEKWQEKHFPWISVKHLGTLMAQLVKQGLVIRTRRSVHACYWYRVDESALAAVCPSLLSVNTLSAETTGQSAKSADLKAKSSDQSAKSAEDKTVVIKQQDMKPKKNQTAAAKTPITESEIDTEIDIQTDAAAAETLPRPITTSESGEYSFDGEAPLAQREDHYGEPALVKATANSSTATAPQTPSSAPPLSPLAAELLTRFKILPEDSGPLIRTYGEDRLRAAIRRTLAAKNLDNPAGFLIKKLREGDLAIAADIIPTLNKDIHSSAAATLDDARLDAIRRENERMAAEDAERERAAQMSDSTGHLTQTLNSIEHLEYA